MRDSRYGSGLVWALATLVIAGIAGVVGYTLGVDANVTTAGTVAPHLVYGWGFGFPLVGLFFGILFFFLIFALIRRAAWGGYRGYGPGSGYWRNDWRNGPPAPDAFDDWHRRAHGEPPAAGSSTGTSGTVPRS